jgi:hypothetical protein
VEPRRASYTYKAYLHKFLTKNLTMASIGIAVDALVDRVPDQLLTQSVVSITKLYSNMSDSSFDTTQICDTLALESGGEKNGTET